MRIIVGMSQCVVDVSRSDFILMIGRQLLFLAMILFVIFFGSMPISPLFVKFVPMIETKESKTSNSASSTVSASTVSNALTKLSTPSSLFQSSKSSIPKTLSISKSLDPDATTGMIISFISVLITAAIVVLIVFIIKSI